MITYWPDIILKPIDGENFEVWDYCYVDGRFFNDGNVRIIPKGFVTDLSSIPKIFRSLISTSGKTKRASVVHDYLIRNEIMSQKECDQVFRKLLLETGVRPIQASIMYFF